MKKRILSMLLLVAMVVTAVPLFAFAALATEGVPAKEPTYEEEDYNALYADQKNLIFAADFFSTNEYWNLPKKYTEVFNANGELNWSSTMNNQLNAYRWKGTTRSFSMPANFGPVGTQKAAEVANGKLTVYGANGSGSEFAISGLYADYNKGYGTVTQDEEGNYVYNGGATQELVRSSTEGSTLKPWIGGVRFKIDKDGLHGIACGSDAGASQPNFTLKTSTSYQIAGFSPALKLPVAFTAVTTYRASIVRPAPTGGVGITSASLNCYHTKTTVWVNPETQEISTTEMEGWEEKIALSDYKNANPRTVALEKITPDFTLENGEYTPYTGETCYYVREDRMTPAIGHASVYQGGQEIYKNDAQAFLNNDYATINSSTDLAYTGCWGDFYAIRYYKSVLSVDDAALNHVADLAKYFRLNIAAYNLLDEAGRLAVAADMAGFTFESERDGENGVAAVFATASTREAMKLYDASYNTTYVNVALTYGLDLTKLEGLAGDCRENTLAMLDLLVEGNYIPAFEGATVYDTYMAALAKDAEAYAETAAEEEDFYNGIYVGGDRLLFAADWYGLNSIWGKAAPTLPIALHLRPEWDTTSERFTTHTNDDNGTPTARKFTTAFKDARSDFQTGMKTAMNSRAWVTDSTYFLSQGLPGEGINSWNDVEGKVGSSDSVNETLAAFIATTGLDVANLSKVKGDDALVAEILALADLNYAFSTAVINYRLANEILEFYGLNKLVTFGARVHSEYVTDKAGIRATFAINTGLFEAMFAKDETLTMIPFGTKITLKDNGSQNLTFVAKKTDNVIEYFEADGETPIKTKEVDGILTYTWTITCELTDAAEYLDLEWSYERFVKIGDKNAYSIAVVSEDFGNTVTMREIYEAAAEINPGDVVVKGVLAEMNAQ